MPVRFTSLVLFELALLVFRLGSSFFRVDVSRELLLDTFQNSIIFCFTFFSIFSVSVEIGLEQKG